MLDVKRIFAPKRRSGLGFAIAWALGIGVGAVAAGAFVGFLVNGPPHRAPVSRSIADVAPPPLPAATPKPVESKTAAATPVPPPATPPSKAQASAVDPVPPPAEAARDAQATQAPPNPPLAPGEIRDVQSRLRALGFNAGPIDGTSGPQTEAGVKQYQQARGLAPTGILDRELLTRLRQESPPPQTQAPPPRRSYTPQSRRDPLLEAIDRLFGR